MQGQTLGLKQLVNRKAPHSLGLETWLLGLQAAHRLGGGRLSAPLWGRNPSDRSQGTAGEAGARGPVYAGIPSSPAWACRGPLSLYGPLSSFSMVVGDSSPPAAKVGTVPAAAGGAAVFEPQLLWRPRSGALDTGCPQRHTVQTDLATKPRVLFGTEGGAGMGKGVEG